MRKSLTDVPLSLIYRSIRKGTILLNKKKAAPSIHVACGDEITIPEHLLPGKDLVHAPSDPSIRSLILYEDERVIAVNKPPGKLTHGKNSLDESIRLYTNQKNGPSLSFRSGPLHRLDRNTSGLILFSASLEGAQGFSSAIQNRQVEKYYFCLFDGNLKTETKWLDRITRNSFDHKTVRSRDSSSKHAETHVIPIACSGHVTLAMCKILTGRTHQIRAQASIHGHPLAGDSKYGGSSLIPGYLLHSASLRIRNDQLLNLPTLTAPLPEQSQNILKVFFGNHIIDAVFSSLIKYRPL